MSWVGLAWRTVKWSVLLLGVTVGFMPRPDLPDLPPTYLCFSGRACEQITQTVPDTTQTPRLVPETPAPAKPTISAS